MINKTSILKSVSCVSLAITMLSISVSAQISGTGLQPTSGSLSSESPATGPVSGPGSAVMTGHDLWVKEVSTAKGKRSCQSCHGKNLHLAGKHIKTGKRIKPMSRSEEPTRYTDQKKVRKWFRRNCRFAWGRECSANEKSAILAYLKQV